MFKKMKLGTKLFVIILIINVISIGLLITHIGFRSYQIEKQTIKENVENLAYRYGNEIDAELELAMNAVRILSQTFEGYKSIPVQNRRDFFSLQLKQILEKNPGFFGVWTCWEPQALDGRDRDYINKKGHDQTGRFKPYWNRANNKNSL
jgi:methyl-accepting chemotaxis protein